MTVGGGIKAFTAGGRFYSALEVASEYFKCARMDGRMGGCVGWMVSVGLAGWSGWSGHIYWKPPTDTHPTTHPLTYQVRRRQDQHRGRRRGRGRGLLRGWVRV
jgi:hypothetical protein